MYHDLQGIQIHNLESAVSYLLLHGKCSQYWYWSITWPSIDLLHWNPEDYSIDSVYNTWSNSQDAWLYYISLVNYLFNSWQDCSLKTITCEPGPFYKGS